MPSHVSATLQKSPVQSSRYRIEKLTVNSKADAERRSRFDFASPISSLGTAAAFAVELVRIDFRAQ
jgi:hypothetical protein